MSSAAGIVIVREGPMQPWELRRLVDLYFEDMVKYVVDVERGIAAVGGEMHADAEQVLLDAGSRQSDLWGANYWPGRGRFAVSCAGGASWLRVSASSPISSSIGRSFGRCCS